MKALILLILLAAPSLSEVPCEKYQAHFETAIRYFWQDRPVMDWEWLAAQAYAESSCNPHAKSPAGAKGLAQFLDGTFDEVRPQICKTVPQMCRGTVYDPRLAILAQGLYMRKQYDYCGRRIGSNPYQTMLIATAAYNAGAGNICIKAHRLSNSNTWSDIATQLHKVTGRHSKETIGYVQKINATHAESRGRRGFGNIVRAGFVPASTGEISDQAKDIAEKTGKVSKKIKGKAKKIVEQTEPNTAFHWEEILWDSIWLNYQYAFGPALIAIIILFIACLIFDWMDRKYRTDEELESNNLSVALWRCTFTIVIGAVLCVSIYSGMR